MHTLTALNAYVFNVITKRANEILQELGNLDDIKYTFDNFPETYKGLSGMIG